MGLLPSHIRLLGKLHRRYRFEGAVCSLGNQEIWASQADIERYLREAGLLPSPPTELRPHSSRLFDSSPELRTVSGSFVHPQVLFQMMGLSEYVDVDKFDYDHPALLLDLNRPVPAELHGRYGLVLDGGTVEHIFDVRGVMENVVRLTQVGGCVVHLASFDMDHGFYGLSPCFFHDFYRLNGFSDFSCFLMATDYSDILEHYDKRRPCFEYEYGMALDCLLETSASWLIFFAARKVFDLPELEVPTQGVFAPEARASPRQPRSAYRDAVPVSLQNLLAPLRPMLRRLRRGQRCRRERRTRVRLI